MEKKIGLYICTDCEIGNAINLDELAKVAAEMKVPLVKTHPSLCQKEGVEFIKKDMAQEGVNAVIIAACSLRVNYDVFDLGIPLVERVNLREGVVWSHPPNDEDTQMMAEDYIRMGILKMQKMEAPEPYKVEEPSKNVLIVGGGLAGITAANEAAKAGYDVFLVEKNESLGGWMSKIYKQPPTKPPYAEMEEPVINNLIKEIQQNPKVKIYTSSLIEKIDGAPGLYDVTVKRNGGAETFRVGAIVEAAGTVPYDATKITNLGFGKYPNVITNYMMEDMAAKGKMVRPSDGKPVKSVAFIQCAGQRDENHLPYCSATCCVESLKQAKYIRLQDPDSKAYIFYKDMRTPGHYEYFYKSMQNDPGVFLTKGDVIGITEDENKDLVVEVENTLLGEKISVNADLVVLATGMVPVTALGEEVLPPGVKPGDEFIPYVMIETDILNLEYRQGGEVPVLINGYPDSNFICFPYETRRTGVYAAGSVRAPMDIPSTVTDATGAALKAIQCVELTSRGEAVHPRVGDTSYIDIFLQKCTQCKRCTEECPFGAINEDEKANPLYNPTRCRRCGICMGACPERIMSFKNYSVDMIGNMVKNIEVPEEEEEKPRIIVFACENDAYPALDMVGLNRLQYNSFVRVIPLRCAGSMNLVWVADALSKGIDGILILGCQYGDDYQCHMATGSHLAKIRLSKVSETLDRLKLESGRVQMEQVSISEYYKIPRILDEFLERLEGFGPNPYKGF
ncbi:anaerobic glycerol-3-phosphate dehydrogenase subunit B [bacterium BMS3Bbin06]|nr:anaerobic glycerol-3-phosphate dehydrogenase subunit B [bacterium BMS3Abin08]GBE35246.1 anaerobic glycerol-3-phosphate dehydrogenase subunit B [bacterium BMS3Bbin06]HDY70435.1 hydrogenase iron-sulfur subunit [Nitrospirota bacterium]